MNKPAISIIIPTWNGLRLLKICLASLNSQTFKDFEVIIVDNGSTDGTIEFLKSEYIKFKLILLDKNFGFSTAVNKGIKLSRGKFVFILNNDVEVEKNCLKILMADINKKKIGFVVPKFLNFYKRDILELAGKEFVIDSVGHLFSLCVGKKDINKYNKADYTFLAPGGATLFKKEVFEKIGVFDEDFFLYLEDADLSLRAQLAGIKGWYNPKAIVYHMGMATSSKNMAMVEPICFRNMTINIIKNYPISLILHNFNWLKIIFVHLHTVKYLISKSYLSEVLKAEWFILRNLNGLLNKRKEIQKSKIVSDQYIIENIREKRTPPLLSIMRNIKHFLVDFIK